MFPTAERFALGGFLCAPTYVLSQSATPRPRLAGSPFGRQHMGCFVGLQ